MRASNLDGKQLAEIYSKFYPDEEISMDKLQIVLAYIDPILYYLKYYKIKGNPYVLNVPDYNRQMAAAHRPWQEEILRATTDIRQKEVAVLKSRQLGISEVGVMSLLYLMDTLSAEKLKFLYLFPKPMWGL